ncbi:MAG: tail fiber domain-containing protein [Ruminococcus sp.]|nr:tail fiber domain-containing protein [Ruminococcus sp.]MBR6103295.1 tail fiber domain-containing protein [Ruminococcus sp.]
MANTVSRYTGANPNGESDVMSRLTVTDASYFKLADITAADSYTLRLWIKASGSRTVLCYIGDTLYSIAATTAWKEIKHTAVVSSAGTCELHLPAGTYYIWHPMLERSTKASDYRQAPEDTENRIDAAENNAINTSRAYVDGQLVSYATSREVSSQIEQLQTSISLSIAEKVVETKNYATDQANTAKTDAINTANAATDTKLAGYVTTTQHSTDLTLLSDRITAAVTATTNLATYVDGEFYQQITQEYTSSITQTAQGIQSNVSSTYATISTVNGINTRLTTAESTITQQADQIALRVTKAGLVSEINQSSGTISMTANRFTISSTYFTLTANGTVTASKLTLTGGTIQSSNYATSGGSVTAGTKIDLSNGSISSKNFSVSSSGTVTLSNATFTGGTIKSTNYASGSAGTKINLSTGAIDAANFSITSSGVLTATSATLNNATITGTFKSTSGDSRYFTRITGGEIETFYDNKRVSYMMPVFSNNICQLAILGSGNYDGVAIGAAFDDGIYTYYRCNIQDAATAEGCRHHFVGTVKFDDRFKSNVNFNNNLGLAWGGNIGLRYYTQSAGAEHTGLWLGLSSSRLCLTGSQIDAHCKILLRNDECLGSVDTDDNCYYVMVQHDSTNNAINFGSGGRSTYVNGSTINVGTNSNTSTVNVGRSGGSTHIYGTTSLGGSVTASGGITLSGSYLALANSYGITCNSKIAFRYYSSSIYCGVDTIPLRLVGSAIYANGSPVATTSDARLKTNIEPIDDRYIKMLDDMDPVKFCYTEGGSKRTHTGFIAQNVLEALTKAGLTTQEVAAFVDVNGDGDEYALRYEEFIAILLLKIRKLEDLIKNNRR